MYEIYRCCKWAIQRNKIIYQKEQSEKIKMSEKYGKCVSLHS